MFTLNDIIEGNAGKFQIIGEAPDPDFVFRAAPHDSRQIEAGDLFVAIKGTKVDGHRFIAAAAQRGAVGALCSEYSERPDGIADNFLFIVVPDVVEALLA